MVTSAKLTLRGLNKSESNLRSKEKLFMTALIKITKRISADSPNSRAKTEEPFSVALSDNLQLLLRPEQPLISFFPEVPQDRVKLA